MAAVEIHPFRREILMRRQRDGLLGMFPIYSDVRSFDGRSFKDRVEVVSAGFVCDPFSLAGKKGGADDERNTWPDTIRIIREVGPDFAWLENVPGLLAHEYFGTVLGDLAESGFDAVWDCFPASAVGAPHRRDRVFILAYARGRRLEGLELQKRPRPTFAAPTGVPLQEIWNEADRPPFRVDDELPRPVDEISALGDAQVPAAVVRAWETLSALVPHG